MKMNKIKLAKELRRMGYHFSNSNLVFPLGSSVPIFYIARFYNKKIISCDYFKFYEVKGVSYFDFSFDKIDYQEYLRLYNILGKF